MTNTTVRIGHYVLASATSNTTAHANATGSNATGYYGHPATFDDWEIGGSWKLLGLERGLCSIGAGYSQSVSESSARLPLTTTRACSPVCPVDCVRPLPPSFATGINAYHIFLIGFGVLVTPLCFGNFQNTTVLQMVVLVIRFVIYFIMLVCPLIYLVSGAWHPTSDSSPSSSSYNESYVHNNISSTSNGSLHLLGNHTAATPAWQTLQFWFNFEGISSVYGTAVFTFMMHHSIPGLVTPIRPERQGKPLMGSTMLVTAVMCVRRYHKRCREGGCN